MDSHPLRALAVSALLLLVSDLLVLAQPSEDPHAVARLVSEQGAEVKILRGEKTLLVTRPMNLYRGDKVQVEPEGVAMIYYDERARKVRGGEGPVPVESWSHKPSQSQRASSSLHGAVWRFLTRLTGGKVEGPAQPNPGGERGLGDESLVLVLPEWSRMLDRQPTFAWGPTADANGPASYDITVVSGVDPARCWKGGYVFWETTTQDTVLVYDKEAPTFAPYTTYRVEVSTPGRSSDFACLEVAGEEEQARMSENKASLESSMSELDRATRNALWAGVLIEDGYYSDALEVLRSVLQAHPDHATAREIWGFLLRQAVL